MRESVGGLHRSSVKQLMTVILSAAKDLKLRILRSFAVFAAQDDGVGLGAFCYSDFRMKNCAKPLARALPFSSF